ncbi:MAG: hypothetical protein GC193_14910 [Cryomorphaceae bacterium]|nr:hypothetical protein [Cryomorphaceae bacterium]
MQLAQALQAATTSEVLDQSLAEKVVDRLEASQKQWTPVQKGDVILVTPIRADRDNGIICAIPGDVNGYLPKGSLLGESAEALETRFEELLKNKTPIAVRITRTGKKEIKKGNGTTRVRRISLEEVTPQDYDAQLQNGKRLSGMISKGESYQVEVLRAAYTRDTMHVCGLKVRFVHAPEVEALLHESAMGSASPQEFFDKIEAEPENLDYLRFMTVQVAKCDLVNGQLRVIVRQSEQA